MASTLEQVEFGENPPADREELENEITQTPDDLQSGPRVSLLAKLTQEDKKSDSNDADASMSSLSSRGHRYNGFDTDDLDDPQTDDGEEGANLSSTLSTTQSTPRNSSKTRTPNAANSKPAVAGNEDQRIDKLLGLVEGLYPHVGTIEDVVDMVIGNQKALHHRILELQNELQKTKLYSKTLKHKMAKETNDREYERSNLVVYNLPISEWKQFLKHNGNDKYRAANDWGFQFVRGFFPKYEKRDLSCYYLSQNCDKKGKKVPKPVCFRILIKFPNPADASTCKTRCLKSGIVDVRLGLTAGERETANLVQSKVDDLNSRLDPDSETIYARRHIFHIHEVLRENTKKVVKVHESFEDAERILDSSLTAFELPNIPFLKRKQNQPTVPDADPDANLKKVLGIQKNNSEIRNTPTHPKPSIVQKTAEKRDQGNPQPKVQKTVGFKNAMQPSILNHIIRDGKGTSQKSSQNNGTPSIRGKRKATSPIHDSPSGPLGQRERKKRRQLSDEEKAKRALAAKEAKRRKAEEKKLAEEQAKKDQAILVELRKKYDLMVEENEALKKTESNSTRKTAEKDVQIATSTETV